MQVLVIDRNRWLRGEGEELSYLLRDDSKMCCLGFLCRSEFSEEELSNKFCPLNLVSRNKPFPENLSFLVDPAHHNNSILSLDLMNINDSIDISDEERERRIAEKFQSVGIEVQFIN